MSKCERPHNERKNLAYGKAHQECGLYREGTQPLQCTACEHADWNTNSHISRLPEGFEEKPNQICEVQILIKLCLFRSTTLNSAQAVVSLLVKKIYIYTYILKICHSITLKAWLLLCVLPPKPSAGSCWSMLFSLISLFKPNLWQDTTFYWQ